MVFRRKLSSIFGNYTAQYFHVGFKDRRERDDLPLRISQWKMWTIGLAIGITIETRFLQ